MFPICAFINYLKTCCIFLFCFVFQSIWACVSFAYFIHKLKSLSDLHKEISSLTLRRTINIKICIETE